MTRAQENPRCITEVRHRWSGDFVGELRCWQPEAETHWPDLFLDFVEFLSLLPALHFDNCIACIACITWKYVALAQEPCRWSADPAWLVARPVYCLIYVFERWTKFHAHVFEAPHQHWRLFPSALLHFNQHGSSSVNNVHRQCICPYTTLYDAMIPEILAYWNFDRSSKCLTWRCLQQKDVFPISLSMCFGFPYVSFQLVHFACEDTCHEELHNCTTHLCNAPRSKSF